MKVYAAHPMTCYGSTYAAEQLAGMAVALPGAQIVDPEHAGWETSADWRREWPTILDTLAGLVVFADRLGTIGTGCMAEIADAIAAGVPVAGWHEDGGLVELVGLELVEAESRSAARAAFVLLGDVLGRGDFPGADDRPDL